MAEQLTTSAEALRLFFTDDIYLVRDEDVVAAVQPDESVFVSATIPAAVPLETATVSAAISATQMQPTSVGSAAAASAVSVSAAMLSADPATATSAPATADSSPSELRSVAPAVMPSANPVTSAPAASAPATAVSPQIPASSVPAPAEASSSIAATSGTVFKYLGKNQKNVLILVNDGENDVSNEAGKELLRNLVKAMQLTANDFALLNYSYYTHVKFDELSKFFSSTLVLGFGVNPAQLGLDDQPAHSIGTHGAIKLIFTGRLDLLAGDQEGKKKLWSSLKQFIF
jgi:hypothetical protein